MSQGNISTAPMDLAEGWRIWFYCVWFSVPFLFGRYLHGFWCLWESVKRAAEHADPLTAFNGRTREDRDTRELQGIGSSYRLSHWRRERDRLASGLAHARSVPRCVQGSSRPQANRWWRRWSALDPRIRYRSGDRFRRFSESISPCLKAAAYRKSPAQPPPRSPREEDLWLKSIFRMTVRVSCSSGSKSPQPENRKNVITPNISHSRIIFYSHLIPSKKYHK